MLFFLVFLSFFFVSILLCLFFFFFFSSRRRHTRSLCDWSSDVCSSDLSVLLFRTRSTLPAASRQTHRRLRNCGRNCSRRHGCGVSRRSCRRAVPAKIGRASCRERV